MSNFTPTYGTLSAGTKNPRRPRWPKALAIIVVVLLALYLLVSWFFSQKLIAQQFPSAPEASFADFNLPQPEDIAIEGDGVTLIGWFFDNPAPNQCAVIMLHGYSGNRAEVLIAAPLFWDRGCDLLYYDLRGHGQSSGGFETYGVHDKFDELAAVDWLKARSGLVENQIGLMGWSYGAATSIQAAAERSGLAFVIADASYSSLADIASVQAVELFGGWAKVFVPGTLFVSGLRADFDPSDASPEKAAGRMTTPLLLVHSVTDEFTPYTHSEAIYANSDQTSTRLYLTEWGAPHGMSYSTNPDAYSREVDRFLADFAPNFGSAPQ